VRRTGSLALPSKGLLGGFVAILFLSIASRVHVLEGAGGRCRLDGAAIEPLRIVELMDHGAVLAAFCSFGCAREWPTVPASAYWRLRDEVGGALLDAEQALFVQSRVPSVAARGERIHVFRDATEAMRHCEQFGGVRIANPLARPPPAAPASNPGK
jgi:hypothetical protein